MPFRLSLKKPIRKSISEAAEKVSGQAHIFFDFFKDWRRYRKAAMTAETSAGKLEGLHLEAQITRDYHRVEKGLSLGAPRRPFGAELLQRLNALMPEAEARHPSGDWVVAARDARDALIEWNSGGMPDDEVAPLAVGGDRLSSVESMFATRHSVRDFSDRPVGEDILIRAAELARISPSVCNRSPWTVRYFMADEAQKVLKYQTGNAGWGESVPVVAVVSVDLAYFAGTGERNQAFIEGGIFSTSLMWALHGLGLDSCMLNLSLPTEPMDRLRRAVGMDASDVPIMMMAVGYGREGHRVTRSPRRSVYEFCEVAVG